MTIVMSNACGCEPRRSDGDEVAAVEAHAVPVLLAGREGYAGQLLDVTIQIRM
jgi:hypothetical protein